MRSTSIKAVALCGALLVSSAANAAYISLSNENLVIGLNIAGTGSAAAEYITADTITYLGASVVVIDDLDSSGDISVGDTFTDYGYLNATSYSVDGNNSLNDIPKVVAYNLDYSLTSQFSGWTGEFTTYVPAEDATYYEFDTDVGSELVLTSNDLNANTSVDILTASLASGFGNIDNSTNSGSITFTFELESVLPGYFFFDINGTPVDLAIILAILNANGESLYFVRTVTTNDSLTNKTVGDIANELGVPEAAFNIDPDDITLVVENTGALNIRSIPEPGMLSLMGLALFGLAGFQRRRRNNS